MARSNKQITPIPSYPHWSMPTWLPDDELVTVNGLSADMKKWLDANFMNGAVSHPIPDYHEVNRLAYKTFVHRYGLKMSRYSDYCQHAISSEKACTLRQRSNDCEDILKRYYMDHLDMFVLNSVDRRKRRIDVIVGQPYRGYVSVKVEKMARQAVADGLELLVSARQSYHLPGDTALIAIARPGVFAL
jgi:multimeric flavodoxin WrbA